MFSCKLANPTRFLALLAASACLSANHSPAATLEVGPQKAFSKIEDANAKAQPGDVILVYPAEGDRPYSQTAVRVRQKNLTFRAKPAKGNQLVQISGQGFNYSGKKGVPRAIFQFDLGADDCTLEGFELFDAHNNKHNGAGVRINQANRTTIRGCSIHDNSMGIMSSGNGAEKTAVDQRIENCRIYHNGDLGERGYNHNLYLGGQSATISACEIYGSLTGHNLKSRAHYTRVEYCYIHDSANRELDLVDAADTTRPDSDAVLLANLIVKDPGCKDNREVIYFGQDGGRAHNGTLHLTFNTIVTPFVAPVVTVSSREAKAVLVGNLICDGGAKQNNQRIANVAGYEHPDTVTGAHNWFSGGFSKDEVAGLPADTNRYERAAGPLFIDPAKHDYHLTPEIAKNAIALQSVKEVSIPPPPGSQPADAEAESPLAWQYRHPANKENRPTRRGLCFGALVR